VTKQTYSENSTCETQDCENRPKAKGLCNKHWNLERKKNAGICIVSNCKNLVKAKNLCETHYNKERSKTKPKCSVENCTKNENVKGFCNQHYIMWKKHGDPLAGAYRIPFKNAIDHGDGTRTCTKCMERLPNSSFHKDKNAPGGLRAMCKKCRIDHVKNWYKDNKIRQSTKEKIRRRANPEKYTEKESLRYEKDREKRIALATEHSHKRRARKHESVVEKGISKSALKKKFGTKCYYCQKEMDFSVGIGRKFNKDMATIEHLVPVSKGGEHIWENIVLACRHCNISKNSKSIEEFEEFSKDS
jgi:5-methylcytosine-specific restriction endonuclease McrA